MRSILRFIPLGVYFAVMGALAAFVMFACAKHLKSAPPEVHVLGGGITCPIPASCIPGLPDAGRISCEGGMVSGTGVDAGLVQCRPPSPLFTPSLRSYVNGGGGSDVLGQGTEEFPFESISAALSTAAENPFNQGLFPAAHVTVEPAAPGDGGGYGFYAYIENVALPQHVFLTGYSSQGVPSISGTLSLASAWNTSTFSEGSIENFEIAGDISLEIGYQYSAVTLSNVFSSQPIALSGGTYLWTNMNPFAAMGAITATANGSVPVSLYLTAPGVEIHAITISGIGCTFDFVGFDPGGSITATDCTGGTDNLGDNEIKDVAQQGGTVSLTNSNTYIYHSAINGLTSLGSNITAAGGTAINGNLVAGEDGDGGAATTLDMRGATLTGTCTLNGGVTIITPPGWPTCTSAHGTNTQTANQATTTPIETVETVNVAGGGTVSLAAGTTCNDGIIIANGDAAASTAAVNFNNCTTGALYHVQDNVGGTAFHFNLVRGTGSCSGTSAHPLGNGDAITAFLTGTNTISCTSY